MGQFCCCGSAWGAGCTATGAHEQHDQWVGAGAEGRGWRRLGANVVVGAPLVSHFTDLLMNHCTCKAGTAEDAVDSGALGAS